MKNFSMDGINVRRARKRKCRVRHGWRKHLADAHGSASAGCAMDGVSTWPMRTEAQVPGAPWMA